MGHGIDKGFPECLIRVLIKTYSVKAHDTHRMASIPVDKSYSSFDRERHRPPNVFMIAWISIWLGPSVGVCKDAALREHYRGVLRKKNYSCRSRIMITRSRVMPHKAAYSGSCKHINFFQIVRITSFSDCDEISSYIMVEIVPFQAVERFGFKRRSSFNSIFRNLVLVTGRGDIEPILQELHQSCTNFFLKLDNIAEPLIFEAVFIQLSQKYRGSALSLYTPVSLDKHQYGQFLIFRSTVLGMCNG